MSYDDIPSLEDVNIWCSKARELKPGSLLVENLPWGGVETILILEIDSTSYLSQVAEAEPLYIRNPRTCR